MEQKIMFKIKLYKIIVNI